MLLVGKVAPLVHALFLFHMLVSHFIPPFSLFNNLRSKNHNPPPYGRAIQPPRSSVDNNQLITTQTRKITFRLTPPPEGGHSKKTSRERQQSARPRKNPKHPNKPTSPPRHPTPDESRKRTRRKSKNNQPLLRTTPNHKHNNAGPSVSK
jgi:hypothetical protein